MTLGAMSSADQEQPVLRQLAAFAVDFQLKEVQPDVVNHARRVLLDTIGVTLAGSGAREVRALAERLGSSEGACTLPGFGIRSSCLNAALVIGTAGTWLDYDAAHRHPPGVPLLPAGHPPIHTLAAALPVAEALDRAGADLLAALIVGYDIGARIGVACRVRGEIHPHGTFPTICAGVAAARLAGADCAQMEATIRLAAGLTLMPAFETAYQGKTVRNTFAGIGALNGTLAAQLARLGFGGSLAPISAVFGCVSSDWLDVGLAVEQLGRRFEITQGYVKPYPCCRYVHPAIEAAEELRAASTTDPEAIDSVEVATYRLAAELDNCDPRTELAAKFSIPYVVASTLVRGHVTQSDFSDEAIADPLVRRIAARVRVREDPSFTAMTPSRRPATVTLYTRDGAIRRGEVERSSGGPDAPWSDAQVLAKFRTLASPVIGEVRTEEVAKLIDGIIDLQSTRQLMDLLGRSQS